MRLPRHPAVAYLCLVRPSRYEADEDSNRACIHSLDLARADGISPAPRTCRLLGVDLWRCLVAWFGCVLFFTETAEGRCPINRGHSSKPSRPNKKIMLLSLVLVIATSLSSFLWLPYTGVAVSRPQLIMISITTFILSVTAYLIAWRRSQRSNKSLEPTADGRDTHG